MIISNDSSDILTIKYARPLNNQIMSWGVKAAEVVKIHIICTLFKPKT